MLYIFDVNGTLADRDTANILPGVREWFAAVDWATTRVAFATNQGGVGLRYWMESAGFGDPSQYPTEEQVRRRISTIEQELVPPTQELNSEIYVCFAYQSRSSGKWSPAPPGYEGRPEWSPAWRKPAPGMLLQAMHDVGANASNTVFVGDSDEDLQAALEANISFHWADDFFGRES